MVFSQVINMGVMEIKKAALSEAKIIAELAIQMWDSHTIEVLLMACQNWAKEQGCVEFASDCELTNEESLRFHLNMGFEEANRIICFTKKL